MLRGYRFFIFAAVGLAIFVALGTGTYFGSLYAPNHKQYHTIASDQSAKSEYRGPSQSLPDIAGLPSTVERAIANPQPATGEDHEKRDLAAQEASALWAFWMVVASFASVLITAIGTAFLYKQIVLTREAVEDTSAATEAMREANRITSERSHLELRPYLSHVDEGTAILRKEEWDEAGEDGDFVGYRVSIAIKNSGSTPARNVTWSHGFYPLTEGFHAAKFPSLDFYNKCFDIAPGDITTQIIPYSITREILDKVEAGTVRIHVFARLTYDGLDDVSHILQFRLVCDKLMLSEGIWAIMPDHYIST